MSRFAICVFALAVCMASTAAYGFQWPVEDLAVTATFGENRWNHFHGGIDIGGGEQEIRPIDEGEVIFYFEESGGVKPGAQSSGRNTSLRRPEEIPTGLGNFLVLEHARGIRSLYAHLKPGTMDTDAVLVKKPDVIGVTGETGSSLGRHLHFEVSDREFHQLVNPLKLLPELPDFAQPTIGAVLLTRVDGNAKTLGADPLVAPGTWNVILETYDVSEYVSYFCPMAPYQIQLFLNGQETVSITFDALEERGRRLGLPEMPDSEYDGFYVEDWLINAGTISVPEGEVNLEVVVSDFSGNESSRMFALRAGRGPDEAGPEEAGPDGDG